MPFKPKPLAPGEWHLPFFDVQDAELIESIVQEEHGTGDRWLPEKAPIKISVARCARVSYESFETNMRSSIAVDLALYNKLLGAQPIHASPAEHQATPDTWDADPGYGPIYDNPELHGNFVGWVQYRKTLLGENGNG